MSPKDPWWHWTYCAPPLRVFISGGGVDLFREIQQWSSLFNFLAKRKAWTARPGSPHGSVQAFLGQMSPKVPQASSAAYTRSSSTRMQSRDLHGQVECSHMSQLPRLAIYLLHNNKKALEVARLTLRPRISEHVGWFTIQVSPMQPVTNQRSQSWDCRNVNCYE